MPPRRRKNFFRIKPRWEGRSEREKRLFLNRIRLAFANYDVHVNYSDSRQVNRALRQSVLGAVREFLPQNNVTVFVNQLADRYYDLIREQFREISFRGHIVRRQTITAMGFMRLAERELDDYMADSVTYFDDGQDD